MRNDHFYSTSLDANVKVQERHAPKTLALRAGFQQTIIPKANTSHAATRLYFLSASQCLGILGISSMRIKATLNTILRYDPQIAKVTPLGSDVTI